MFRYKTVYYLVIFFVALFANHLNAAGINKQMDNIFTEMSNYTAPGVYETESRGVYSGGHYIMHSKIFNENLVNFQAPSLSGGCGGIDVFGGSFSFVNSDQIIQLMRQVASNAKGYAFQLALDNMCPGCMKWMNELQSKIQNLNNTLSNSCELAQGIVNSTGTAMGMSRQHMTDITLTSLGEGIADDFSGLKKHIDSGLTAVKRLDTAAPDVLEKETGALTYIALRKSNINTAVVDGDTELLETIMSITGTVVVGDMATAADGGESLPVNTLVGNKITLSDLIEGDPAATIYDCSLSTASSGTDLCRITNADTKQINLIGMQTRILQAFTDPGALLDRIKTGDFTGQPTTAQKNIMASLPASISSKIFELGPISPDAASDFLEQTVGAISLEIVKRLTDESFRVTLAAVASDVDTYKAESTRLILENRERVEKEYQSLLLEYGSIRSIQSYYNNLLEGINIPIYAPSN